MTSHSGGDAVVNSRKRRELQKIHRAAAEREAREAAAEEEPA
ncbi:MAG: hypothetical protein ACE10D_02545 [Planctomycetota bacterium]|nr:hypothetical protein [Planctomycetota bacterium]